MGCQCTTPVNSSKQNSNGHSIEDRSARYKSNADSTSAADSTAVKDFSKPKKMASKNPPKKAKVTRKQLPKEFYLE